jgi:hypothetical protein
VPSEAAFVHISEAAFLHIYKPEAALLPSRKPHRLNAHVQVQAPGAPDSIPEGTRIATPWAPLQKCLPNYHFSFTAPASLWNYAGHVGLCPFSRLDKLLSPETALQPEREAALRMCERQLDVVENRTRVMRAPTRGLAKALRGIYWGGGGGTVPPPSAEHSPSQWRV